MIAKKFYREGITTYVGTLFCSIVTLVHLPAASFLGNSRTRGSSFLKDLSAEGFSITPLGGRSNPNPALGKSTSVILSSDIRISPAEVNPPPIVLSAELKLWQIASHMHKIVGGVELPVETMDRDNIMETLRSGQHSKVMRIDTTTGIFACPKLLYGSDAEEEDNLPNAQEENRPVEVQGPGPVEPFQSLEPINSEFEQSADQVRRIMALSDGGRNPLLEDGNVDLPEKLSYVEWIEYLMKKGPTILTAPRNRRQTSKILRKLGGVIEVLPPGNNADDLGDWRDRSKWVQYVSALVSELMMVEDRCSSEVRDLGLFVLTTFQYSAFLELMAQEILSGAD